MTRPSEQGRSLRINVHDFSGHPFQVHLSRELAARGHDVEHTYSAEYVTGRGKLDIQPSDPANLRITPIEVAQPFDKYDAKARLRYEFRYARAWRDFLAQRDFDVVVSCNLPLFSQALAQLSLQRMHQPWIFWHQDIYSHGINEELRRTLPAVAKPLSRLTEYLEKRQVRQADHIVAITHGFVTKYAEWQLPEPPVTVIPNWASLEDIRPVDRDNDWSRRHQLPTDKLRLLYSGTLGRKHNPMLLLDLLDSLKGRGQDPLLIVCSQGAGADELAAAAGDRPDVKILGFQPAEEFDQVLSSGDIVVTLLEPEASNFSVPSKVLSYLAAGRVVVGLMPPGNPAGADIRSAGGWVSRPDAEGVTDVADWITNVLSTPGTLIQLGKQSRALAEERFDIATIGDQFEDLLTSVTRNASSNDLRAR